jgi:hypothetical protein
MAILQVNIIVECDRCGDETHIELTNGRLPDERDLTRELNTENWEAGSHRLDFRHLCDECVRAIEEEDEADEA